jgi:TolB-like protein
MQPGTQRSQLLSLFNELKRRNVFKVGVAYVVVAWLVAQVLQLVFESFGTPGWAIKTVLVLLATGLPFALFFAWAFEITPEGIKREHEVDRSQSTAAQTGKKLNHMITVVMALALAYFAYDKFVLSGGREAALIEAASQNATQQATRANASTTSDKSIAVLPFANMSSDPEQEYFSDGMTEEIISKLSRIDNLAGASRTSVQRFKNTEMDIREIAATLGVRYVLEGSVRKAGDQLRITAQLIDSENGFHVWSRDFNLCVSPSPLPECC